MSRTRSAEGAASAVLSQGRHPCARQSDARKARLLMLRPSCRSRIRMARPAWPKGITRRGEPVRREREAAESEEVSADKRQRHPPHPLAGGPATRAQESKTPAKA